MASGILPDSSLLMKPVGQAIGFRRLPFCVQAGHTRQWPAPHSGFGLLRKIECHERGLQFSKSRLNQFPIWCLQAILDHRQEAMHGLSGSLGFFLGCLAPLAVYTRDLEEC